MDGGAFLGRTVGIWNDGVMKNGKVRAIYLSPTADQNIYDVGLLAGDVSGAYYRVLNPNSTQNMGVWTADAILTSNLMAEGITIQPSAFDNLSSVITARSFTGLGYGTKGDGSIIGATAGNTYNLTGQNWGILQASFLGNAPNNSSGDWRLAEGGRIMDNSTLHAYFLATIVGSNWAGGELEGAFKGVTLRPSDSNIVIGSITGDAVGTYLDTTWHARGVGEWVELAQLSAGPGGVNFDSADLAQLVSVPITETYSSLLTGSGTLGSSGTITNASMDISFYSSAANALSGIWAALINANYTNPAGGAAAGAISFTDNAGTSANLTDLQLSNNTWLGNVNGTAPNNTTFQGQAGGTYTGQTEGTLTGAGAGTWSQPQ